jgi:hypothetical protein
MLSYIDEEEEEDEKEEEAAADEQEQVEEVEKEGLFLVFSYLISLPNVFLFPLCLNE